MMTRMRTRLFAPLAAVLAAGLALAPCGEAAAASRTRTATGSGGGSATKTSLGRRQWQRRDDALGDRQRRPDRHEDAQHQRQ